MGIVGEGPEPAVPGLEIEGEGLAGAELEEAEEAVAGGIVGGEEIERFEEHDGVGVSPEAGESGHGGVEEFGGVGGEVGEELEGGWFGLGRESWGKEEGEGVAAQHVFDDDAKRGIV